jgi:hypothetical protein
MSYEAVGLLPNGAQIALEVPLILLGVLGLVLALSNSRRLGGRAAMSAALGSAAFALDAVLNIVWIAMSGRIGGSPSVYGWLDFFTVTNVVLLAVAMTLLAVSFTGRAASAEPAPLFGAPAAPGGYPGYRPPPYQPPAQPQPPYSPPPSWPSQGPAQPAGPQQPVFPQPGGYAQPPGYPPQPSYPQSEQPPAHPQPQAHPQPPSPPAFAPPNYPHQAQPHQAQPAPVYPPAPEAPTQHVPSASPEPPHSAPPAHHS